MDQNMNEQRYNILDENRVVLSRIFDEALKEKFPNHRTFVIDSSTRGLYINYTFQEDTLYIGYEKESTIGILSAKDIGLAKKSFEDRLKIRLIEVKD